MLHNTMFFQESLVWGFGYRVHEVQCQPRVHQRVRLYSSFVVRFGQKNMLIA